jgi:hypothetical protein
MTFHIPVKIITTGINISESINYYDENADYNGGELVRKGDEVYKVEVEMYEDPLPQYQEYLGYDTHATVQLDGIGYKLKYVNQGIGCWQIMDTDVTGSYADNIIFDGWNGKNESTFTPPSDSSCNQEIQSVKMHTISTDSVLKLRRLQPEYTLKADGSTHKLPTIHVYGKASLIPDPIGYVYDYDAGILIKKNGYSTTAFKQKVDEGQWYQLPKNTVTKKRYTLIYQRLVNQAALFDTKQYTVSTKEGTMSGSVGVYSAQSAPNGVLTSVVLGNVVGDSIKITFMKSGNTLSSYTFDLSYTNIVAHGITVKKMGTTVIAYSDQIADFAKFDIYGDHTELGMVFPAIHMDMGDTNLKFQMAIKNFDKVQVSNTSGYTEIIKGNRIQKHKGTFEIPLENYDSLILKTKEFTQDVVAIDSCDNILNLPSDSKNIFSSTKLIGRATNLQAELTTTKNKNKLDEYIQVSFDFEEIV